MNTELINLFRQRNELAERLVQAQYNGCKREGDKFIPSNEFLAIDKEFRDNEKQIIQKSGVKTEDEFADLFVEFLKTSS